MEFPLRKKYSRKYSECKYINKLSNIIQWTLSVIALGQSLFYNNYWPITLQEINVV